MNSDVMPSIVRMEKNVLDTLLKEVKETVATDVVLPVAAVKPSFGIVDMWNIRRKMKTARSLWNR